MEHPEFPAAVKAAPNFTRQVLHTVIELEYQNATNNK